MNSKTAAEEMAINKADAILKNLPEDDKEVISLAWAIQCERAGAGASRTKDRHEILRFLSICVVGGLVLWYAGGAVYAAILNDGLYARVGDLETRSQRLEADGFALENCQADLTQKHVALRELAAACAPRE